MPTSSTNIVKVFLFIAYKYLCQFFSEREVTLTDPENNPQFICQIFLNNQLGLNMQMGCGRITQPTQQFV